MTEAKILDKKTLWGETASGRVYTPFDFRPEQVDLSDIAAALSKICRFNGHCRMMYSVAEHSLLVAKITEEFLDQPDLAWAALMHDAPEAYLGDMVAPIKRGMLEYQNLYDKVEEVVFGALGLDLGLGWDTVWKADMIALAIEARDLLPSKGRDWKLPFEAPEHLTVVLRPIAETEEHFRNAIRTYAPPIISTRFAP